MSTCSQPPPAAVPLLRHVRAKTLDNQHPSCQHRFVLDNRPPESHSGQNGADASLGDEPNSAELVCRIPEETLFQLQQIYEALEAKGDRRTSAKPLGLPSSSLPPPRNADDAGPLQTPKKTPSKVRAFNLLYLAKADAWLCRQIKGGKSCTRYFKSPKCIMRRRMRISELNKVYDQI